MPGHWVAGVLGERLLGHGAGVVAIADGPLAGEAELGGAERRQKASTRERLLEMSGVDRCLCGCRNGRHRDSG